MLRQWIPFVSESNCSLVILIIRVALLSDLAALLVVAPASLPPAYIAMAGKVGAILSKLAGQWLGHEASPSAASPEIPGAR